MANSFADSPRQAEPPPVLDGDFAVFSGKPAFAKPLHVGRPNIGDRTRLLERLNGILDSRWVTNAGCYVRQFEAAIAEQIGVRHCIAMCNATVALEILIRAAGLRGEVIVPSFTFIATAHALQWQEITPVFADIDPATHTLDPARVEAMITPRTTGIIGVHLWGRGCNVEGLQEVATRHGLKLLFDAAHAFGCSHRGRMIGSFGEAEVFSFHGTKFLNSGEGGAVVTKSDEIAARIRLMKNFGFAGEDRVVYLGTNGKMNEFSAALGLTNLECMEQFVAVNRAHYERYRRELAALPGIALVDYDAREKGNYQYVVLEIDAGRAGISRNSLLRLLRAENVLARRYFYPGCHRMQPYRSYFPHAGLLLPHTEALCERVLLLPTGTALRDEDVSVVCRLVRAAVREGPGLERRLASHPVRPPA
jgi:dTDP-4-amino-4,6-dideoxygalactose transaminase